MSSLSSAACIDLRELDDAIQDAPNWDVLTGTLYTLCREHPGHADQAGVNAKLCLIGRSFATAIERQIKSKGTQGSSLRALSDHICRNHRKVDAVIQPLREVRESLDEEKVRTIIAHHGAFCGLLRPLLRDGRSARSFAAKYLHFHCPAVPIYDTFARSKLERVCPWQADFALFDMPEEADEPYHWFALRFWQAYQAARVLRPKVTVRLLDLYLLWSG